MRRGALGGRRAFGMLVAVALLASLLALGAPTGTPSAAAQAPLGAVDAVRPTGGGLAVEGWSAWDTVHVWMDGRLAATATTGRSRPDVRDAHGWPADTGFAARIHQVDPGSRTVCVYGIHPQGGENQLLGCRTIDVPVPPVGSIDDVFAASNAVVVAGWSAWPEVHVYIDGKGEGIARTGTPRPDVAAALGWPRDTGYRKRIPFTVPGDHQLCAWAVDPGRGRNQGLGCRPFSVGPPVGNLELAARSDPSRPQRLQVRGWATSDEVHLYLDDRGLAIVNTQTYRPDVEAVFADPRAGFDLSIDVVDGGMLCAYAIGRAGNTGLGCAPVAPTVRIVTQAVGVPFAEVGGVTLRHPSVSVELIGYHESGNRGARQLEGRPTSAPAVTMLSRGRGTGSRTAADVAIAPHEAVVAPVSGRVIASGTYALYCRYRDDYVWIAPDDRPEWVVRVLHIDGVAVVPGERVRAGRTVLAPRPTQLPFRSQVDALTAEPSWPHVHIEVVDPSIPNPPGSGC